MNLLEQANILKDLKGDIKSLKQISISELEKAITRRLSQGARPKKTERRTKPLVRVGSFNKSFTSKFSGLGSPTKSPMRSPERSPEKIREESPEREAIKL